MRLAKAAAEFKITYGERGGDDPVGSKQTIKSQPERMRFRAHAVDYYGSLDGIDGGIRIIDDPENVHSPTPWYVIRNTRTPMTYFIPTVIQQAPMTLARGDAFRLRYQIIVHPTRQSVDLGATSRTRASVFHLDGSP